MSSPQDMMGAIVRNLPEKTGRSLEQWIDLIAKKSPRGASKKDLAAWLKEKHGLGTVTAEVVAYYATLPADHVDPTDEEMIDAQYAGDKAALRPIYDKLVKTVKKLGKDVSIGARQSMVSFNRTKQFASCAATAKTRLDLSLALGDAPANPRLKPSGKGPKDRITHKVGLTKPADIDAEVIGWLKRAYEAS